MISKINKGPSFGGTLSYVMEKDGAQVLHSNCAADSPADQAKEMHAIADLNSRCTKPVFHASLSAPHGEHLSDDQWRAVGRDYLSGMGIDPDKHQHTIVRHTDAEHDHIHIVANRVNAESLTVAKDNNERRESMRVCRALEKQHGLQQHENHKATDKSQYKSMRLAIGEARSVTCRSNSPSMERFAAELDKRGYTVTLNQSKTTGKVSGISYADKSGGKPVKGSALGKGFSYTALDQRITKSADRAVERQQAANTAASKQAVGNLKGAADAKTKPAVGKRQIGGAFNSKTLLKKLTKPLPIKLSPGLGAIAKALEM